MGKAEFKELAGQRTVPGKLEYRPTDHIEVRSPAAAVVQEVYVQPGQQVDIVSLWGDEHVRRVHGFTLLAFDIPAGQAAAYYPEVNPLVPLESIGDGSHTPTSKFIAIKLERARDDGRIL